MAWAREFHPSTTAEWGKLPLPSPPDAGTAYDPLLRVHAFFDAYLSLFVCCLTFLLSAPAPAYVAHPANGIASALRLNRVDVSEAPWRRQAAESPCMDGFPSPFSASPWQAFGFPQAWTRPPLSKPNPSIPAGENR